MIDLDTLRKAKGYVLAIVDESTGEYKPVSSDVVPVIRCKDCKMYHREDDLFKLGLCAKTETIVSRDDFCSQAERKEE